jgi:hypothetical protein
MAKAKGVKKNITHVNCKFTSDIAKRICEELAKGRSMYNICKKEKWAPDYKTVFSWLYDARLDGSAAELKEFLHNYARAREAWADAVFEDIIELSDGAIKIIKGKDPSDSARVNAVRTQIDTRKWALARMSPKKYAEKNQTEHTGDLKISLVVSKNASDSVSDILGE